MIIMLIICWLPCFRIQGQQARLMFYNAENLFDPFNDSLVKDDEYTPAADKHWTYGRFLAKAVSIYRVIAAVGEWEPPVVAGFCEIENRFALESLLIETPLQRVGYRVIHQDSPDPRGIDVAMIYRPDAFQPDTFKFIPVSLPGNEGRTRDILYVRGRIFNDRVLHLFFNHWPSRAGGVASAEKRIFAAGLLKNNIDSILATAKEANIIAMGDFNDEPWDESLRLVAGRVSGDSLPRDGMLFNLTEAGRESSNSGTISHDGFWQLFDQVLVSASLLEGTAGLVVSGGTAGILRAEFQLSQGEKWNSDRPYRTYLGPFYQGGYSDHLPVYVDIFKSAKSP